MLDYVSRWLTANHMTAARVAFILPIALVMEWAPESPGWLFAAWVLFFVACLTDWWDGMLARHQQSTTKLGKLLDPVADKLLIGSLLILLVEMGRAPAWLVVLLIARELTVTGLRAVAAADNVVIAANAGGKWKTISQMFATGFLIIHYETLWLPCHEIGIGLLWLATLQSLWTGWLYIRGYFEALPNSFST
jgi:CDP-diacylglycerol--glycerol-3-phosphate 3-phosphatidyltransferase